jgi:hypothetical protein
MPTSSTNESVSRPSRAFCWPSPAGATQSAWPSFCRPVCRSFANSPFVRWISLRRVLVHPVAADRAVPSAAYLRHVAGRTQRADTRNGEIAVWRYAGWLSNLFSAGIARLHIGLRQIISRNRRTSLKTKSSRSDMRRLSRDTGPFSQATCSPYPLLGSRMTPVTLAGYVANENQRSSSRYHYARENHEKGYHPFQGCCEESGHFNSPP